MKGKNGFNFHKIPNVLWYINQHAYFEFEHETRSGSVKGRTNEKYSHTKNLGTRKGNISSAMKK